MVSVPNSSKWATLPGRGLNFGQRPTATEYEFRAFGLRGRIARVCVSMPRYGGPVLARHLRWFIEAGHILLPQLTGHWSGLAGLNPRSVNGGGKLGSIANTLRRGRAAL